MSDPMLDEEATVASALDHPWHLLEDARMSRDSSKRQLIALLEQVGVSDRRVREDYEGRFAIELLQNAHDACFDDDRVGQAWFVLTDSALLVGNEGRPFDGDRITALTRLGASTKRADLQRRVIGYKGIGFSSVFSVTNRPQISSDGILFGFDRAKADEAILAHLGRRAKHLAARCFPFRLSEEDFGDDLAAVCALHDQGAATVIRLPLERKSVDDVSAVISRSLTAEALLFMPHLDRLTVDDAIGRRVWSRAQGKTIGPGSLVHLDSDEGSRVSWLTASSLVEAPPETRHLEDDIWHSVEWLNASVALPWAGNKIDPSRGAQRLHVYFPTDDQVGRALLAHGDFFLHSSRRYVQDDGPGGKVTEAVARGVADLVVQLAEAVAGRGGELLQALAYTAPTSGYGETLSRMLDGRLREARIVRSHSRNAVHRARDLSVIETNLEPEAHKRLFDALRDPHTLVAFDDDRGDAGVFLRQILEVDVLTATEVAQRLSMAKVRGSYDDAVRLLRDWYESLNNQAKRGVRTALATNPTVRDEAGKWRVASEVRRYERDLPTPPLRLRPARLRPPTGFELNAFVNTALGVQPLTAATLFDDVLAAVVDSPAVTATEGRKTLRFLLEVYRKHPDAFDRDDERLGQVRVPCRAIPDRRGGRPDWRAAATAYFPSAVTGDRLTEELFAPFGDAEFVDIQATGLTGEDVAPFLQAIGVLAAPRLIDLEFDLTDTSQLSQQVQQWVDDVVRPAACARHQRFMPRASARLLDRLDQLVGSRDEGRVRRLADVVARLEEPQGEPATVMCGFASCYHRTRVTGLQSWLISTQDWIPVRDSGPLRWAPPSRAWYGVPRTQLLLPRAQLDDQVAERLGCVSFGRPTVDAIEAALRSLARRHPVLAEAPPEVCSTADLLLDRLENALPPDIPPRQRVPLPGTCDGARVWAPRPMIADVQGIECLPGITLLPEGLWKSVATAYELDRSSDVVTWEIRVGDVGNDLVLDDRTRAELVALLTRRSDRSAVARLVGRLNEHPVGSVYLDLRLGEAAARTPYLRFLLSRKLDVENGKVVGGTLFTTPETVFDYYLLAAELADYLGTGQPDLIHSYFTARTQVLKRERIDAARIAEARAALETIPTEDVQPLNVVSDPAQLVVIPDHPSGDHAATQDGEGPADFSSPWPAAPTEKPASKADIGAAGTPGARRPVGDTPERPPPTTSGDERGHGGIPEVRTWTAHDGAQVSFSATAPRPAPFGSYTRQSREGRAQSTNGGEALADAIDEVDERAMNLVRAYGESLGARVERVDRRYLGWDLEFHFDNERWPVEVKGMAQESRGLVITRNEMLAARTEPQYRIAVVTGLRGSRGRLTLIRPSIPDLESANLEPLSWLVTPWRTLTIETEHEWVVEAGV